MPKCAECGYLASRNYESRELEETELGTRNGEAIVISLSTGMPIYELPVCFMQVIDLRYEFKNDTPQITPVIQQSRECNEFVKWKQGFTPKEHREMIDRQWMQKHQEEHEKADKEWREKQEARHSREEWLRYIFLGIVTIVATLIATGKI
jgi:hypothetical protein